mmetsp:Transcript_21326/g.54480  ORF Transcript_21326/g.54480 Transcript_21326/m.54480 type:complete len:223 (-) Transcript_21326:1864-2532(-)
MKKHLHAKGSGSDGTSDFCPHACCGTMSYSPSAARAATRVRRPRTRSSTKVRLAKPRPKDDKVSCMRWPSRSRNLLSNLSKANFCCVAMPVDGVLPTCIFRLLILVPPVPQVAVQGDQSDHENQPQEYSSATHVPDASLAAAAASEPQGWSSRTSPVQGRPPPAAGCFWPRERYWNLKLLHSLHVCHSSHSQSALPAKHATSAWQLFTSLREVSHESPPFSG